MAQEMQSYNFEFKKLLNTEEFESLAHYDLSNEDAIKKVVLINALPKITSSERVDTFVSCQGKTAYSVVYQTEEGNLKSLSFETEWQNKTSCDCENFFLKPIVKENTVTSFSSLDINLSSLINIEVYGVKNEAVDTITNLENDYVTYQENLDLQRAVSCVNTSINMVSELEVSQKVDDILYSVATIMPQSATAGIDTITLEGEVNVISYASVGGKITTFEKVIAYKEELPALLSNPSFLVDASLEISGVKVTASVSEIDSKSNLIFSVEATANAVVYSKETVTVTSDVFSLNSELNIVRECVKKDNFESSFVKKENASGVIDANLELTNVVLVSPAEAVITDIEKVDDGENVKGITLVKVIALAGNEYITIDGQVPFALHVDSCDNTYKISASVLSAVLRSTNQVEINLELSVEGKKYSSEFVNFVSNLEEVAPLKEKDSAVRIHIVKKGEDLFAVAKKLLVRPEQILEQNPSLSEGMSENDRVVVYCPLSVKL